MCVIIIKESIDTKLPTGVAKTSSTVNPHGLGIVWLDTFEMEFLKSNDYKRLDTLRPFIAHFRYASIGKIGKENVHPFRCGRGSTEWLMQNGTIFGMGDESTTDTQVLAQKLGGMARNQWNEELAKYNCRFTTINTKTHSFENYNHSLWTVRDGVWYSKDNVLQDTYMAVYGTLKKGYSNYRCHLTTSTMVGKGVTKDKYPLVVRSLPCLLERKGIGHNVDVDVFKVNKDVLARIDRLEGNPTFYERVQIPIKMATGDVLVCWCYFYRLSIAGVTAKDYVKSYISSTCNAPVYTSPSTVYSMEFAPQRYIPIAIPVRAKHDTSLDDEYSELCEDDDNDIPPIADELPMCPDCFNDVEYDGFSNYYCSHCGGWFKDEEIKHFMC